MKVSAEMAAAVAAMGEIKISCPVQAEAPWRRMFAQCTFFTTPPSGVTSSTERQDTSSRSASSVASSGTLAGRSAASKPSAK
jgi:hypothetical protein